ncbi:MAG: glycosyltransferase family 39 protein [Candidatus Micrarchaeaceae archaeon]
MDLGNFLFVSSLASTAMLLSGIAIGRKELSKLLDYYVRTPFFFVAIGSMAFFASFALFFVSNVEQLYFDENIYVGVALNILHNLNEDWCQFGTGLLRNCYIQQHYHDPTGWSFFIAIAFLLFGPSNATASYAELFSGTMCILLIYFVSSLLFEDPKKGAFSSLLLAFTPSMFIWSRTIADTDVPLLMFTLLSIFFFLVYSKTRKNGILLAFLSSLLLAANTRIEGLLAALILLVSFFFFGKKGIRKNIKSNLKFLARSVDEDLRFLVVILVGALVFSPIAAMFAKDLATQSYGQPSSTGTFNFAYFSSNANGILSYLEGETDSISYYPSIFPQDYRLLAVFGILVLIASEKEKAPAIFLLLWFASFFIFYSFYYAGSPYYGVDSRFMLQITPQIVIVASLTLSFLYEVPKGRVKKALFASLVFFSLVFIPFLSYAKIITVKPSGMPQQYQIHDVMQFFYSNYSRVPRSCLVFSFTPDIWYLSNYSSAQIGYLGVQNESIEKIEKNFPCYVLDYGYWCTVPPYQSTTCAIEMHDYVSGSIVNETSQNGEEIGFFYLNLSK